MQNYIKLAFTSVFFFLSPSISLTLKLINLEVKPASYYNFTLTYFQSRIDIMCLAIKLQCRTVDDSDYFADRRTAFVVVVNVRLFCATVDISH